MRLFTLDWLLVILITYWKSQLRIMWQCLVQSKIRKVIRCFQTQSTPLSQMDLLRPFLAIFYFFWSDIVAEVHIIIITDINLVLSLEDQKSIKCIISRLNSYKFFIKFFFSWLKVQRMISAYFLKLNDRMELSLNRCIFDKFSSCFFPTF